jgi:hypothetical protein
MKTWLLLGLTTIWLVEPRAPASPASQLADSNPSVAEILERALAQAQREDEQERAFKRAYFFTRHRVTEFKNADGEIKKRQEKSSQNDPLRHRANDLRKAMNSAAGPRARPASDAGESETDLRNRQFEKSDFPVNDDLLRRFDFQFVKFETLNGRRTYVLDFLPIQPPAPERKFADKFLNKTAGRVWIDVEDAALARADLRLTKRVNVVGGLAGAVKKFTCLLERERTTEGWWYFRLTEWHLEGREAFVHRVVDSREERTLLRRLEDGPAR